MHLVRELLPSRALGRVGKTHCQGHQDPSKRVPIFLGTQEANLKIVSINRVSIPPSRTVVTSIRDTQVQVVERIAPLKLDVVVCVMS